MLGRWITAAAVRLDADRLGPRRIAYDLVAHIDSAVHLSVRAELLAFTARSNAGSTTT